MIHSYVNLHLDLIAASFVGAAFGYLFGWIRGRGGRDR